MPPSRRISAALLAFLPALLGAQTGHRSAITYFSGTDGRPFALVQGNDTNVNGDWHQSDELRTYAQAHPGHYILFSDNGTLHRVDSPAALQQAQEAYAPMLPLNARQAELSARMKPLSAQQHELSQQQHAAAGNPEEQGRIGREQGRVGEQQGEIGRQQGEVGRQQGEVGRNFYHRVQELLSSCLHDNSCPTVQGS